MSRKAYHQKLEALRALRSAPDAPATVVALRKALQDRNNFLVSKAAAITADLSLADMTPELLAAFDRFMTDPSKTDPQCWAKNAIAKALKDLGHRGAQVYIRGIAHVQPEPVWGGVGDSAATLRGTCALALVDALLDDLEILGYLGDALADPEKQVRIDAAIAIGQLGRPEGALLLRLKALMGDEDSAVVGQCFTSLAGLAPKEAIPFLSRFLKRGDDDVRLEAAAALAQSREPQALEILKQFWDEHLSPQLRRGIIASLAACPQPEAAEWLLSLLASEPADRAATALTALAESRFRTEVQDRAAAIVTQRNDSSLAGVFSRDFTRTR